MTSPLQVYADGLRGGMADEMVVRFRDGAVRPLQLARWTQPADAVDERALSALRGPVLDLGCGPGRHLHALARRGVFGLGVDLSAAAVGLARGAGANAIVGSIFDELPGTGQWRSALLLDGNIGIGGDPARLLRRVGRLLAPSGRGLVELACPKTRTVRTQVRLEAPGRISDWFDWADVSVADVDQFAAVAGFSVERCWAEGGRWFALLVSSERERAPSAV